MKRAVVFGLGKMFRTFLRVYDSEKVNIVALCDNNMAAYKIEDSMGIPFIQAEEIKDCDPAYIVVTSSYFDEIKRQLVGFGLEENKIIGFAEVFHKMAMVDEPIMDVLKKDLFVAMAAQDLQEDKFQEIKHAQEKTLFLNARNYIKSIRDEKINLLEEVEFQVFSQWGEDGIIQWLIHNVTLDRKIFVEFGVEDYKESNTRFLLMNNNWSGLVIDGDEKNIQKIEEWELYWKYDLLAVFSFITKENINSIILEAGIEGDIGLLSVDIDGSDYWVLNAITCIQPRILICEYNNIFGAEKKVTVPYDEAFFRTDKHYSNLYWGCSLGALCGWAQQNNYYYMGSNSAGNNAFFVRKDCISKEWIPKERKLFIESKYRESRDENGRLTFLKGRERLYRIKDMELMNLENGCIERIEDIYQLEGE